jgi:hypothetical protein
MLSEPQWWLITKESETVSKVDRLEKLKKKVYYKVKSVTDLAYH